MSLPRLTGPLAHVAALCRKIPVRTVYHRTGEDTRQTVRFYDNGQQDRNTEQHYANTLLKKQEKALRIDIESLEVKPKKKVPTERTENRGVPKNA